MYYTDSQNVLFWLASDVRRLQIFVANRTQAIRAMSPREKWRFVPGTINPADMPSRGITIEQLAESKCWNQGPDFLWTGELPEQPNLKPSSEASQEIKKAFQGDDFPESLMARVDVSVPKHETITLDEDKIEDWLDAIAKVREQKQCDHQEAQNVLFATAQREAWSAIIDGKKSAHRLKSFDPELDSKGVLRCKTRWRFKQKISYEDACPILLPVDHWITKKYVEYVHVTKLQHTGGREHLLNEVQREVVIPRARRIMRRVLHECIVCRYHRAKLSKPLEAPLPWFRGPEMDFPTPAFQNTGVDVCGPWRTKFGRGKVQSKRYGLLFVCLAYSTIHLEMLGDLSAGSFLMAFKRFVSRRRVPSLMISDNGTNFISAAKFLEEKSGDEKTEQILQEAYPSIKWEFIVPSSPSHGGIWERHVGIFKSTLRKIIPAEEDVLTDEELSTVFAQSEAIVNGRPLGYVSSDTADPLPVRPIDFVGGSHRDSDISTHVTIPQGGITLGKSFRRTQELQRRFWERFKLEVMPKMRKPHYQGETNLSLEVGDVVIVVDDSISSKYVLGIVTEVFPSQDGIARSALVSVKGKILKRSLTKLIRLVKADEIPIKIPKGLPEWPTKE
jgi:hypothetical protein